MEYNFPEIEKKWQNAWRERKTYKVLEDPSKKKYYVLDMFPYPSGAGLHVGHPLGYIASDIFARYKRHQGFNVLHPMGYDSFGLPAEQYAIQTGQHPAVTTANNIARYREQLDKIGFCYDWDREVRTSDPDYYEWTQWIFALIYSSWYNKDTDKAETITTLIAKFEENGNYGVNAAIEDKWYESLTPGKFFFGTHFKGEFTATDWKSMTEEQQQLLLMHYRMAYLADSVVNWCPALGTVLANDEIKDGVSERGGHPVVQKKMRQWSMRISAYAERLLKGLETIDWSDSIKEVQRNWIGRSEGALIRFDLEGSNAQIEVFTTRPDTIFGVSFMTLAPEHDLVPKITTSEYRDAVEAYIAQAKLKTERDRQAEVKNVTGQFTGAHVIHPFTGEKIPVWIGDYVLAGYGTGAVMAVPAGDQRDYDFAKKFSLTIPPIFKDVDLSEKAEASKEAVLINSQMLDGLSYKEATPKIIAEIEKAGLGEGRINYRMRDAVFSRQRYWGEPFPVYYEGEIPYICDMDDLPIELPEVDKYLPTESGEPPLARASGWRYHPAGVVSCTSQNSAPHPQPLSGGEGSAQSDNLQNEQNWFRWKTANPDKWEQLKSFARLMRSHSTKAEDIIWQSLRSHRIGYKIRRQHPIQDFIVDFICLDRRLIIEIDGKGHNHPDQVEYDQLRTSWLNFHGYKVIRFTNEEVLENKDEVIRKIKDELDSRPSIKERSIKKPDQVNEDRSAPLSSGEGLGVRLEYNTMPGWAGSSWYFLRYMDPHNGGEFASREKIDYWGQVDLYMGGAEHGTGHLLYSRFWTKILFDHGYIGFDEPFKKMINQGMITGRSSFIYRLKLQSGRKRNNFDEPGQEIFDSLISPIDAPPIFITHELAQQYENSKIDFNKNSEINNLLDSVSNDLRLKSPGKIGELECWGIQKLHVDINKVNNDILDLSSVSDLDGIPKNACFVLNSNSEYLCGSEIEKMSKSKLNVQTPDELVEKFGADTLRCYEMFLGPVEQSKPWDTKGISGVHNFLRKFWRLYHTAENNFVLSDEVPTKAELKSLHKTIKKVTEDLDRFSWNTCISAFMICVNELQEQKCNKRSILEPLCVLLSPFAPHISEEIWERLNAGKTEIASVATQTWPTFDEANLQDDAFDYPVSFNGKTRYFLPLPVALGAAEVESLVRAHDQTAKYLEGKEIKKIIVVPKRIVNVVV